MADFQHLTSIPNKKSREIFSGIGIDNNFTIILLDPQQL